MFKALAPLQVPFYLMDQVSIDGVIKGEKTLLSFPASRFPSLPFKPRRNFEIRHGDVTYRCFPVKPLTVMKWVNLVKIYYELATAKKGSI